MSSAYRSSLLVKTYKERGGTYLGKKNDNTGLNLWFDSKWRNQRGEEGYKYKSDVYRPTVKVNDKTPTTFNELTKKQIERQEKARTEGVPTIRAPPARWESNWVWVVIQRPGPPLRWYRGRARQVTPHHVRLTLKIIFNRCNLLF